MAAFVLIGSPYLRQATATRFGSTRLTATWGTPVVNDAEAALMLISEMFCPGPFPAQAEPCVVHNSVRLTAAVAASALRLVRACMMALLRAWEAGRHDGRVGTC